MSSVSDLHLDGDRELLLALTEKSLVLYDLPVVDHVIQLIQLAAIDAVNFAYPILYIPEKQAVFLKKDFSSISVCYI